jgi:hypothetical protein
VTVSSLPVEAGDRVLYEHLSACTNPAMSQRHGDHDARKCQIGLIGDMVSTDGSSACDPRKLARHGGARSRHAADPRQYSFERSAH